MTENDWLQSGAPHVWMPYTQMQTSPPPVPVVATEGVRLQLADGRRVIDGLASWWTACHGYNHPHIREAVSEQLSRMPHVMFGGIAHEPACKLAARLARLLPGDLNRVFFSDSGSVAVEVAMKIAVQYWRNRAVEGRHRFVSFRHAYHGDTTGAMSVCDPINSMHAHFKGFLLEQYSHRVPVTDDECEQFDAFLRERREQTAAVVIEPLVQGAGGMKFHPPGSLRFLREACDRHDVLLIADELATGFGRTGTMFACEQADITPDVICLGKALTGGTMGLAATAATEKVFAAFLSEDPTKALMHGPTYMANPLACAAASASLDIFEQQPILQRVAEIEATLAARLAECREFRGVVDVRCKGAIGVVQVERLHHLNRLRDRFLEAGVWLRPFADMIYTTPPLCISNDDLHRLCAAVVETTREWSSW